MDYTGVYRVFRAAIVGVLARSGDHRREHVRRYRLANPIVDHRTDFQVVPVDRVLGRRVVVGRRFVVLDSAAFPFGIAGFAAANLSGAVGRDPVSGCHATVADTGGALSQQRLVVVDRRDGGRFDGRRSFVRSF